MADDSELLRQGAAGDEAAFRRLVDRHVRYLYAIAQGLTGNPFDAEDVVQETLTAALRGGYRGEASVRTWLVRILVRQAGLLRRKGKRHRHMPLGDGGSTAGGTVDPSTPPHTAATEARLDLATMLQSLSPEHRAVIVLRELEGLTYEEMASALEVPRGTVESRLHRAREELRRRFKGYL